MAHLTSGIPKSVAAMDKHPHWFGKFGLGTRFYQWVQLLRDLFDTRKAHLLSNPTITENAGTLTFDHVAYDYVIDGVVYTDALAANVSVIAGANTAAGEHKQVLLSVDTAGAITQTASAAAADAASVIPPDVPVGECPIATFVVLPGYTTGVSVFSTFITVVHGHTGYQTAVKPEPLPDVDM